MLRLVLSAVVVAAASLVCPALSMAVGDTGVNLIRNGGFERPLVVAGSYKLFSTHRGFAGWRVVGAPGNVAPISGTYTQNGFAFPARSGKQWIDLTGLSNTATGVAQTVRTTPGARYTLKFWVGNVHDPGGIFGVRSTIDVLVNGHRVLAARNATGTGSKSQTWKHFTRAIKATSSTTTIEFLNADPRTDNEDGLDAVSLVKR